MFPWWLVLVQGIITLILGISFLYYPYGTLLVLVMFLGAYWFVNGLFGLVSLAMDKTHWGWKLLFGVLGIIAGLAILTYPVYSAFMVPYIFVIMIGFFGIIMGFMGLFAAFRGGGWGAGIVGILILLFGFLLLFHPVASVLIAPYVLGTLGILGGICGVLGAIMLRSIEKRVGAA